MDYFNWTRDDNSYEFHGWIFCRKLFEITIFICRNSRSNGATTTTATSEYHLLIGVKTQDGGLKIKHRSYGCADIDAFAKPFYRKTKYLLFAVVAATNYTFTYTQKHRFCHFYIKILPFNTTNAVFRTCIPLCKSLSQIQIQWYLLCIVIPPELLGTLHE